MANVYNPGIEQTPVTRFGRWGKQEATKRALPGGVGIPRLQRKMQEIERE
jgi:hypothetical protein